ncbi:PTS sugar transporter subunit IIA [Candidatus Aerophobetes bacterium]|uniref:PTS sugar transporter subunit IIA n=1 Tax=Aerophobetes bacterium TaxID=2030807 RepID=A0A2A4WYF1_UNCAE|nr:MAG: PTS sugar transporter subunit IIA [Candidatus Aerophobetes bacterium]
MDLKIKDVAELLNVSETTIRRWLTEGKIPAYRLHHQYRFSRIEIENWMMSFKMSKEQLQGQRKKKASVGAWPHSYGLYQALSRGGVYNSIEASTKEEVIRKTMDKVALELKVDPAVMTDLLLDRENLMATGLNNGIAVPHTRDYLHKGATDVVSCVCLRRPLSWGSLDGKDVHTLFFLFATDDKRHLQLLAKIAHLSSSEDFIDFVSTKNPTQEMLLDYVKQWETQAAVR